jgi:hypothetical protein
LADANFVSLLLWPIRLKKSSPVVMIFSRTVSDQTTVAITGRLVPLAGKISALFLVDDWG